MLMVKCYMFILDLRGLFDRCDSTLGLFHTAILMYTSRDGDGEHLLRQLP